MPARIMFSRASAAHWSRLARRRARGRCAMITLTARKQAQAAAIISVMKVAIPPTRVLTRSVIVNHYVQSTIPHLWEAVLSGDIDAKKRFVAPAVAADVSESKGSVARAGRFE